MPEIIDFRDLPLPLDDFEKDFIHPDNITAVNRRKSIFEPLSQSKRWKLYKHVKRLQKHLNDEGYNRLCAYRWQLWEEYTLNRERYVALRSQFEDATLEVREEMLPELSGLKAYLKSVIATGRDVNKRLDELQDTNESFLAVVAHLEYDARNHKELIRLSKQNKKLLSQMRQENAIYKSLLLDCFAGMPDCHYVNAKNRIITPRFSHAGYTVDSHWFLLETSRKGFFGSLVRDLPYRIKVVNLIKQEVIDQMSLVTGKQVEVIKGGPGGTQLWYRVNRLDAPGGLPKDIKFYEVLNEYPAHRQRYLPFPAGVTVGRQVRWYSFHEYPNLLIAGSAGSGKSNELNNIIATAVMMNTPDELRLVLIDNKGGLELRHFEGVPHQLWKTITTPETMLEHLHKVEDIIKKRMSIMARARAKIITEYNERVSEENRLPRVLVVVDELATIVGQGKLTSEIHLSLQRIINQGRALGVHVILCTQMPKREVVPTMIKASLSARMAGQVTDDVSSMVILDSTDASNLPRIPGRMFGVFGTDRFEFQCAYISDDEVARAVARAKEYPLPREMPDIPLGANKTFDDEDTAPVETLEQQFMKLSLEQFEGQLSANKLHDHLALQDKSPGAKALRRVFENIKQMEQPITLEGKAYTIKRVGRAYYLSIVSGDVTDGTNGEGVDSPEDGSVESPVEVEGELD